MQIIELIADIRKEEAESKAESVQFVLTSRRWSDAVEKFANSLVHPTVIISSGVEMLVYSKVVPEVHLVTPDTKDALVQDLLVVKCSKSIVCCSTAEEAERLGSLLASRGLKNVLLATRNDEFLLGLCFHPLLKREIYVNCFYFSRREGEVAGGGSRRLCCPGHD